MNIKPLLKLRKKLTKAILLLLFSTMPYISYAALAPFTLAVTATEETCISNGALNWTVTGTTDGSTMVYAIYKSPNFTTAIATTTEGSYSGLTAGTYRIIATQTLGGESNSAQQDANILNSFVALNYTVTTTPELCGNDGKIIVNVSAGNPATYAITAGPVTRAPQVSNIFTGLPGGVYNISVVDDCGNVKNLSFQNVPSYLSSFTLGEALQLTIVNCNAIRIARQVVIPVGKSIVSPLLFKYTVHPPDGSDDVIVTRTISLQNSYSTISNHYQVEIPYYNQTYTYDLEVTDGCGTKVTGSGTVVKPTFNMTVELSSSVCSGSYFTLRNFVGGSSPYSVEFLNAPAGFIPEDYDQGGLNNTFPGPYNSTARFGSSSQPVPEGLYSVKVNDACGNSVIKTFEIRKTILPLSVYSVGSCEPKQNYSFLTPPQGIKIATAQVIEAPLDFTAIHPLPYNLPAVHPIILLTNFPNGDYKIQSIDTCGTVRTTPISLVGYIPGNVTVNKYENCGNFNIVVNTSGSNTNSYFVLQKFYPEYGLWGNPITGNLQAAGEDFDYFGTNSLIIGEMMNGNASYNNIASMGQFRVVRFRNSYIPGSPNPEEWGNIQCVDILDEFTFDQTLSLESVYGFQCPGGITTDVGIVAKGGLNPLTYKITQKDGASFIIDNGIDNLFTGLSSGVYNFEVKDACGNTFNALYDITTLGLPKVTPTTLCDGQNGQLSIEGVPYLNFEWWKEGDPATILSTSYNLPFTPFNAATDAGIYYVHLTSPKGSSCIDKILSFDVSANPNDPKAGNDSTIYVCQNSGSVNLLNYLSANADKDGSFTDASGNPVLGNIWSTTQQLVGSYVFNYSVNGQCNGTDTSVITVNVIACVDTDGDGLIDKDDLDDDNDGILDSEENTCVNSLIGGYPGTFFELKPSDFDKFYNGTPQSFANLTKDFSAQFGYPANSGAVIVNITNANVHPNADAFYVRGDLEVTNWKITGTVKSLVGIEQGLEYFEYQKRETRLYTNEAQITNLGVITPGNWENGLAGNTYYQFNNSTTEYSKAAGQLGAYLFTALLDYNDKYFGLFTNDIGFSRWSTYFVRIHPECDYDMDGTPNRLDLDSDGDGCADAIEGAGSFTNDHLTTASGTLVTQTPNQNFGINVDTNGIPIVVGAAGQGIGNSQDFTVNDCVIDYVITKDDINQTPQDTPVSGQLMTNDKGVTSIIAATFGGSPFSLGVAMNVSGVDNNGNPVAVAGSLVIESDGTYTFTPAPGFTGTVAPLIYTGAGAGGATDDAILSIEVLPNNQVSANNPPVAQNDVNSTVVNIPVNSTVLSNDSDPDGNALTVTSASITLGSPVQVAGTDSDGNAVANAGTVTLNSDGTYTYVPATGFIGTVNDITYTISDGNGGTDSAILSINVVGNTGNNTFANDDANSAPQGTTMTGNVLTNDNDPEGNTQTVIDAAAIGTTITIGTATDIPGVGSLTLNSDGTYTFVPLTDFTETVPVIYTACDNGTPQACDQATLYLTSLPVSADFCAWRTTADATDWAADIWEGLDCATRNWIHSTTPPTNDRPTYILHTVEIPTGSNIVSDSLFIETTGRLKVCGTLDIDNQIVFVVDETGKAGQLDNSCGGTGCTVTVDPLASIIVRKSFVNDPQIYPWSFISIPFEVTADSIFIAGTRDLANWGNLDTNTADFFIGQYDGQKRANDGLTNGSNYVNVPDSTIIANKGYILAGGNDFQPIDFKSVAGTQLLCGPTLVETSVNVSSTGRSYCDEGWNLVGVPFVSAFNLNDAWAFEPYFVWNGVDNYTTVMADDNHLVYPFSSFFIQDWLQAYDGLTYDTAGKTFKAVKAVTRFDEVSLKISNNQTSDLTRIRLKEDALVSFERKNDGIKMMSPAMTVPQIYTEASGSCAGLACNALPLNTQRVDLKVRTGKAGTYTIAMTDREKAENVKRVMLTDTETKAQTNLMEQSYTFDITATTTAITSRFYVTLHTEEVSSTEIVNGNGINVYTAGNKVYLSGINGKAGVNMFDAAGKLICNFPVVENNIPLTISTPGLYIMDINTENGNVRTKLIINNK